MTSSQMLITSYALAIALLWGYALVLFLSLRSIRRRDKSGG